MPVDFLTRVLPPLPESNGSLSPCYFMVGIKDGIPWHKSFHTAPEGHAIAQQFSGSRDTYIGLSSYKDPAFGRKAVNALQARCLWADIDVGKAKNSYPTQQAAIAALTKFTVDTGLKPNILVSSGAGFVAYWVLEKPLDIPVWKTLAHVFAGLCKQEGFIIDPACTEDAARILRMPGTVHLKSGNTAQVLVDKGASWKAKDLFETMAGRLKNVESYLRPATAPAPVAPVGTGAVMAQMFPGLGPQKPTGQARLIVDNCAQVLTAGLCAEPQWYAMMSIMRRCVDGLEWAHKLSAMDPARYNPQDTEAKFYHASEDAPVRCAHFNELHAGLCSKCPHWGRIVTPAQLGTPAKTQAPPVEVAPAAPQPAPVVDVVQTPQGESVALKRLFIPDKFDYPLLAVQDYSFSVDHRGILYHSTEKNEAGDLVEKTSIICSSQLYYLYSVCDYVDQAPQLTHWFQVIHANGRKIKVPFVISRDMSLQCIMRWFNNAGMIPAGRAYKPQLFLDFMNAYLRNITAKGAELSTIKKFGWTKCVDPVSKVETEGFVVGKGIITETGLHDISFGDVAQRIAENELTTKGSLEAWKEVPRMYKTLNQKAAQLAVCLAFAAPLMRYGAGTANAGVFSLWSTHSGKGKTQVIRACGSIWGNPDMQIIQRNSSTVLRMRKLATLNHLPCFMDELTDVPDDDLYSLAYTLVDGREKQKLRSSGDKMVETGTWQTMTFTTSNKSFKAAAAKIAGDSEASLLRVMEIECDFESYEDRPAVQEYIQGCIDTCRDNYGLAGPEFIYQLLQNHGDRLHTLTRQCEHWCAKHKFSNSERFISYPLALAIKCGRWAVEFGLIDYDMDALEKWAVSEFMRHNRAATEAFRAHHDEILRHFLLEKQNNTLTVVQHARPNEWKETPRGTADKYIVSWPIQNVYIRREVDDGKIYIAASILAEWCRQRRISLQVLMKELASMNIKPDTAVQNLGAGVSYLDLSPTTCFVFNTADIDVDNLEVINVRKN